jgi:hypothetical protein
MSATNHFQRSRRFRLTAAAIMSVGMIVPLAVFGGTGLAQSSSPAKDQYKITICHHTHSKKHPTHTIRVSVKAWPAHQRHGDTMGPCASQASAKHAKSQGHSKSNGHGKSQGHSKSQEHGKSQDHGKSQGNGSGQGNGNGQNNGNGQGNGKGHGK